MQEERTRIKAEQKSEKGECGARQLVEGLVDCWQKWSLRFLLLYYFALE
jgi:hypothetical protein